MEFKSQKYDVFISYSSKNKNIADAIVSDLENHKIKCWYAPRDVLPGDQWASAIKKAIRGCGIFVLVFSEDSNRSQQVTNEVALAVKEGKTIIPFRLTVSDMNDTLDYYLSSLHWLDAIEPPMSRNIRVLREKILSVLEIDGMYTRDSALNSNAGVSSWDYDPDILKAPGTYGTGKAAGTRQSQTRSEGKGSIMPFAILAMVIAVCAGGFLLFGGKGGTPPHAASNEAVTVSNDADGSLENTGADDKDGALENTGTDDKDSALENSGVGDKDGASENTVSEGDVVVFEDPALEYAVRRSTGIWDRDITPEEAENIYSLNLSGDEENKNGRISSLAGLSAFKWLEELNLSNNRVSDISELGSLTHLRDLNLEKNKIEDITPLENMTAIVKLDLNTNDISDLSPLKNMTKLQVLDVRNNEISGIDVVGNMKNIEELYISRNQIKDIGSVSNLTNLYYFSASFNKIEDISPLSGLPSVGYVVLTGNNIKDISVITELPALEYLEIDDNPIEDYSPLDELSDDVTVIRD